MEACGIGVSGTARRQGLPSQTLHGGSQERDFYPLVLFLPL